MKKSSSSQSIKNVDPDIRDLQVSSRIAAQNGGKFG